MSTKELKKQLIDKITESSDDLILEEVYRLLNTGTDTNYIYALSDNQQVAIDQARTQIAAGESLSDLEVNEKIEKWLNK